MPQSVEYICAGYNFVNLCTRECWRKTRIQEDTQSRAEIPLALGQTCFGKYKTKIEPMLENILTLIKPVEVNNAGVCIHAHHLPNKNKPAFVMLHGLTDDGLCWLRLAGELHDDYDITMIDARGHGQSDTPPSGYTAKHHASDAAAVIRAKGLGPCIVMGHSMGGAEAGQLAAGYPELVRAVILEDPAWRDIPRDVTQAQVQAMAEEWRTGILKNRAMGFDALHKTICEEHSDWHVDETIPWAKAHLLTRPEVVNYVTEPMPDWRGAAAKITCPALLVVADVARGAIVDEGVIEAAHARMPRLRVARVPNAGHNIHRENWDSFISQAKVFLRDL
jgi:pimeloyl-ACP methyl ester carboxylesterase